MILVLDIGGTKTRLAVSSDGLNLKQTAVFDTLKKFDDEAKELSSRALQILEGERASSVVVGLAGTLNEHKEILLSSPNLKEWEGVPIKKKFEDLFDAPVFLENDTALAGLAEASLGAGRGGQIVVYVAVGTGVGGVRIVNGKIDCNRYGFEPGHQILDMEGRDLEYYVSGKSVEARYGAPPEKIDDKKVWDGVERALAIGIHNSILHWSPDVVVLGGSMVLKTPGISVQNVGFRLAEILKVFKTAPKIVNSSLGDEAGLYGGLIFLNKAKDSASCTKS